MSASTERKLRQAARAAGTDKKMLAAQEAAEKKKKSNRRWTIGTIAVVLLIAAILFLDSGFFYTHTTALTVGDESYTPAEVNYRYSTQYFNLVNQYGSYASLLGLNTKSGISGLSKQDCPMLDGGTWKDYFLEETAESMVQTKALTDYARENGIELDEDELAEIDESISELDAYAKAQGYSSASHLLGANYGNGVTTAVMKKASIASALASKAYNTYSDSLVYTPEELEEYYAGLEGANDYFEFMFYDVTAAVEDDGDEETEDLPSEEALAEAHADAEAVSMAYTDGDDIEDAQERFEAAVDSQFEGDAPTLRSKTVGSALSDSYADWLKDASREAGDVTVVDTESGSTVVVFLSRNDNHYITANVRHILVKAEASEDGSYSDEAKEAARARAEEILAEFEAGDKTEESFAALAETYSEDEGSNTNGGLYENVTKGQMVAGFDQFAFEGHKSGDTDIVYGESSTYVGYHVMYYVSDGEQYSDLIARNALKSEALESWYEELCEPYEAVKGSGYRWIG